MSAHLPQEKSWIKFYGMLTEKAEALSFSDPIWTEAPSELSEMEKKHLIEKLSKKEKEEYQLKLEKKPSFTELKISWEEKEIEEFRQLVSLIKLGCAFNENSNPRDCAIKLIITFGTKDNAIQYLNKFEHQTLPSKQLIHDACSYTLPKGEWNVSIWRKLAIKYMPNKEFSKIFEHSMEIENYIKKEKQKLENEIEAKVRQEWEYNLGEEYEKGKLERHVSLELRILPEIEKEKTKIKSRANKSFDFYCRKILQLPEKGHLSLEQIEKLKKYKESSEGIKALTEIQAKIEDEIRTKLQQKHQLSKPVSKSVEKQEYVALNLSRDNKKIKERISLEKKSIFSENTSVERLKQYYTASRYARAAENFWAAEVFSDHDMSEDAFNFYLRLTKKDSERIPPLLEGSKIPILIEGNEIGYPSFYLTKLSPNDPRCGVLGKLTSCCQHLDVREGPARAIISHGIEQESGGFYVLCQRKKNKPPTLEDPIISQCWAWRNLSSGALVFDSVETQVNSKEKHNNMIIDFFMYWGHKLVNQYSIPNVLVGTGSGTPKNLGLLETNQPERPRNYFNYEGAQLLDSKTQRIIAVAPLKYIQALLKFQESVSAAPLKVDQNIIKNEKKETAELQSQIILWCDLCRYMSNEDLDLYLLKNENQLGDLALTIKGLFWQSKRLLALLEDPKKFKEFIEILCKNPIFHFFKNKNGQTALTYACVNGNLEVVSGLLAAGVNPNITDQNGKTALMYACTNGDLSTVSALLTAGADPSIADQSEKTALIYALESGKFQNQNILQLLSLLRVKEGDLNSVLAIACEKNNIEIISILLKKGADVDSMLTIGFHEETPLTFASRNGHVQTVKLLLENRAAVYKPDERNITALMYAANEGKFEIVSLLLRAGADPNIKGSRGLLKGKTIFEFLQTQENFIMIDYLRSEIAKIEIEKKQSIEVSPEASPKSLIFNQEPKRILSSVGIPKEAEEFIDPTKREQPR